MPLSAPHKTERNGTNAPLSSMEYMFCWHLYVCVCHFPSLVGRFATPQQSSGRQSHQDPLCRNPGTVGSLQIATASCPGLCPTAGAPSLIANSNRHSSCIAPAPSPLAGPPVGVEPSALCPPACRPTPRPTFPAGDCHHAARSGHSCLAKANSRCGAQAPTALGSSVCNPTDPRAAASGCLN